MQRSESVRPSLEAEERACLVEKRSCLPLPFILELTAAEIPISTGHLDHESWSQVKQNRVNRY